MKLIKNGHKKYQNRIFKIHSHKINPFNSKMKIKINN